MIFSIYKAYLHINKKSIVCPNRNTGKYMSGQFTKEEIHIDSTLKKNIQFYL